MTELFHLYVRAAAGDPQAEAEASRQLRLPSHPRLREWFRFRPDNLARAVLALAPSPPMNGAPAYDWMKSQTRNSDHHNNTKELTMNDKGISPKETEMTKPRPLPLFFRKVVEARATAAEAKAKQESLAAALAESQAQLERLRIEHNFKLGHIQSLTVFTGPSPEAQCLRAYLEVQAAEHLLKKAQQARQQAEGYVDAALVACRSEVDRFAAAQLLGLRQAITRDIGLRAKLLEAYGVAHVPLASELGSHGWQTWEAFIADLLGDMFTLTELNDACADAVRTHLMGEATATT